MDLFISHEKAVIAENVHTRSSARMLGRKRNLCQSVSHWQTQAMLHERQRENPLHGSQDYRENLLEGPRIELEGMDAKIMYNVLWRSSHVFTRHFV